MKRRDFLINSALVSSAILGSKSILANDIIRENNMNYITLNDGIKIPQIGFGTFKIPADGSTYKAVLSALEIGYRHIDTAAAYFNEEEVGKAVKDSGIKREEIFITSKLWLQDYGYDAAKVGTERSLRKLGTYIDLYLLHQPYGDVVGAWKRLEQYKKEGQIRSIGVSNMTATLWQKFIPKFETKPSVNQVEFHPFFQQKTLREILAKDKVVIEAWAPLGQANPSLLNHEKLLIIAEKYNKSVAQIILRSQIQEGIITLPKTVNPSRMRENISIFDFSLNNDEMAVVRSLDSNQAIHNPEAEGVEERLKQYVITD